MFWRGCSSCAEAGLEISLLCAVDLVSNTALASKAFQTLDVKEKSPIDLCAEQVTGLAGQLLSIYGN